MRLTRQRLSPHRGTSFAASQWLIDEMKRVVPIWKKPVP
jgi:molybdopterin synthase catalytic subunit